MSVEFLPLHPPDLTEAELRDIVAHAPAIAYVAMPWGDFKPVYVSANVGAIAGHEAEAFVRDPKFWQRHIHPDDAEAVLRQFSRLPEIDGFTCEYRFLHGDGRWLNLRDSVHVVRDGKGTPARILGYWTDVTEGKAADEALVRSESRFHVIADSLPAYIGSIDSQQRYRFVNRAYVERWSKARDEIIGMSIRELLGEELYEKVRAPVERALKGEPVLFEYEAAQADGSPAHIRSALVPDFGADGSVQGFFALAEDIVEQKRAERAIRESQATLSAFMQFATDDYAILDHNLRYVDINERAAARLGRTKHDIVGRSFVDLSPHAEGSGRIDAYRNVLATGRPYRTEVSFAADDRERRFIINAFQIQPGLLGISAHDITERANTQRFLSESEQRFRDFVDSVSDRIWETDDDLRIMMFTGGPQTVRDAVMGRRPWEIPGLERDTDEWREQMADMEARRSFRNSRQTHRDGRGRVRHLRTSAKPYYDADGRFAGYRGVSVDETEAVERDEALREKDALLRAFMDAATDAFLIFDENLNYVAANRQAIDNLGLPRDQIIGRNLVDVMPAAKLAGRDRLYLEVLRTGTPAHVEFPFRGQSVWLKATAFRIRDGLLGVTVRDISDRVTVLRALEDSEARYRILYETVPSALVAIGPNGRIREANPAAHKILGYAPGELSGMAVFDLHADTANGKPRARANFERFKRGEKVDNAEQQMVRKDGEIIWINLSFESVKNPDGAVIEGRAVMTDITARKKMDEALLVQDRRLRAILDNIADAVVTMDAGGTIESANPAAEAMFGFTAAELRGQPATLLMAEPDRGAHGSYVRAYLKTGRGKKVGVGPRVVTARRKDGRLFPLEVSVGALEMEGRQIFVGAMRDITERKKMEAALVAAKEEAERADSAKTRFLANASHELRTPLNAILGFSDLIGREIHGPLGDPKYVEYAADINGSGEHLLSLINDLLDVAKIESGHVELDETDVDLGETIDRCLTLVAAQAAAGQIALTKTIPPDVGLLHCDRRALTQILLNLLSNAVKFTPAGGAVEVAAAIRAKGELAVAVADSGVGMAADDIARALETFGQIGNPLSGAHQGWGLGLPIVQSFIKMHGGRMDVDSAAGVGTTITVIFPRGRVVHPAL